MRIKSCLPWMLGWIVFFTGLSGRSQDTIRGNLPTALQPEDTLPGAMWDPAGEMGSGESASAYDPANDTFAVERELELRTPANLDSLLHLWYVDQSLEKAIDEYDPETDTLMPDFPDSVYLARLALIPSVVDLTYNRIVKNYINVYVQKRRGQVRNMLGLSEYYFPVFEEIFDLYGVPYELKYLSVVESALNPRAVSRAGAVGIWQFMYSTGRHYGLTINSLVDQRRDPVQATHAAARYLRDLYRMYGDWTLALAAYNCGPGNVNKAIRRSGGKRKFWEIYYFLPRETRGYVPAFIAATYSMNYYRDHLISPAPMKFPGPTDTLMVYEPVHLKQIAAVLGLPVTELRDLNPQYRADVVPASDREPYSVTLPVEMTARFIDLQDSIFAYRDSEYFDLGKQMASPLSYSASYRVDLPPDKYDKLYYTVKSGDNVGYIADWYDVQASDLRYWNNISRNLIRTGQKLVVYKPKGSSTRYQGLDKMSFAEKQAFAGRAVASAGSAAGQSGAAASPNYVTYQVRPGDTLWEIARKYPGVSEDDIARLNGITDASRIHPGQVIRIKPAS